MHSVTRFAVEGVYRFVKLQICAASTLVLCDGKYKYATSTTGTQGVSQMNFDLCQVRLRRLTNRVMGALCIHMSFHNSLSHAGAFTSDDPFILVKSWYTRSGRWPRVVKDLEIIVS